MKIKYVFFIVVCIMLAISGCGQQATLKTQLQSQTASVPTTTPTLTPIPIPTTPTTMNKADSPKGYLLVEDSDVLFIRWTEADKKLNGQLQVFLTQANKDKQQNDSSAHSFIGVLDKENITLNFNGSVWTDGLGGQTWTGTLKNNKLTLVIPDKGGNLNMAVLQPATVEDYNTAVINIQNKVSDNNKRIEAQKTQQAQIQAQADKIASEQNAVRNANQKLANNIGVLTNSLKNGVNLTAFDNILTSYDTHWKSMENNYQKLKKDTSKNPLTSDDIYQGSSEVYNMSSDRYNITSDRYVLSQTQSDVNNYISGLEEVKKYILQSWDNLQNVISKNTTGTPTANYTVDDITKNINNAQSEIDKTKAIMADKLGQASQYEKQADDLLKNAKDYIASLKPNK